MDLDDPETLESLVQSSKTPSGRSLLGSSLPALLSLLPSSPPPLLLPRLRLLRNLLAGDASIQSSFLSSNGPHLVASLLLPPSPSAGPPPEALRAGLQLLGNAALAGEAHRAAVWARLFPEGFLRTAGVREPGVCDALCMVLDTCCSGDGGRRRLEELCGEGLRVVVEVVWTASAVGCQEEWLEWLLTKICMEEPYFAVLFRKLSSSGLEDTQFTAAQAFVLRLLSECLSERPEEVIVSNGFAIFVLEILKEASGVVDFRSRGISPLPTGSPAIDIFGYSLVILRDICAWKNTSRLGTEAPIDTLLTGGLVENLLRLLCELEPPSIIRKSIAQAREQEGQSVLADPFKVCPYKGFRRDVVSVIGNCLCQRKHVQDEIREKRGILLLLQQCVVDDDNPYLREWGVFAVKSLLEGNVENQREVSELEVQEPVVTPEIAKLGLKVEIDKTSGRAKLVNTS